MLTASAQKVSDILPTGGTSLKTVEMAIAFAHTKDCIPRESALMQQPVSGISLAQPVTYHKVTTSTANQIVSKNSASLLNHDRNDQVTDCSVSPRFETMRYVTSQHLRNEVMLPEYEDLCEWYAANVEDFYLELYLLYELCREDASRFSNPGEGIPETFLNATNSKKLIADPKSCTSSVYVDSIFQWIEKTLESLPEPGEQAFGEDFPILAKKMTNFLFRVFAIVYNNHYEILSILDAALQLNTTFKRFVFFAMEFDLLDQEEISVLQGTVNHLRKEFSQSQVKL
mmetsp:Transcript_15602/g.19338  ORF Transcript_15602/g.19338 Transcript_15602/m.19338 type:complete len:285 (+) Transcript_15602:423-1277(+)